MSKNLKSLNSGILKCGASQFKANIPSIQGVTLSPATENPVNFVFEMSKASADNFMAKISAASLPHASENYFEGETEMVRVYLAMPEEGGAFITRGITIEGYGRCYCYCSGELPEAFMSNLFLGDADVYFVNSVSTVNGTLLEIGTGKIVFMKDIVLSATIELMGVNTVIMNGKVTIHGGQVNFQSPGQHLEDPNILVLGDVEQVSDIDEGGINGDITKLYYKGEWNTTTRAWITGAVYFLNDNPVDPLPEE